MSLRNPVIGSWRAALHDPGLRLLAAAVLVAVAALTSVGFFADRVERAGYVGEQDYEGTAVGAHALVGWRVPLPLGPTWTELDAEPSHQP